MRKGKFASQEFYGRQIDAWVGGWYELKLDHVMAGLYERKRASQLVRVSLPRGRDKVRISVDHVRFNSFKRSLT